MYHPPQFGYLSCPEKVQLLQVSRIDIINVLDLSCPEKVQLLQAVGVPPAAVWIPQLP